MDGKLGAKRVEWSFRDNGVPWVPISKTQSLDLTCKMSPEFSFQWLYQDRIPDAFIGGVAPKVPLLSAVARAGANVTVQLERHRSNLLRSCYELPCSIRC